MSALIHADTLTSGKHWSLIMRTNTRLRLTDIDGGANVGMLFYNPQNLTERYNAPDTLKCQHTFRLTAGHCLYSDMGRIFCSIVADTHGWHDTVCGVLDKQLPGIMELIRVKYGMDNPNALLSRAVAGTMGETIVYTLPGSVRAVTEYMTEIVKTMEHGLFMLHGIDKH